MSSSGTSLARSRSLRKPTAGSSTDLSHKPPVASTTAAAARNISPTRLPALKPTSRLPSTATSSDATSSNASSTAGSFLKRSKPTSGTGLARSGSVSSRPPVTSQSRPPDQTQAPQPSARSRYPPNASVSGAVGTSSAAVKRPTSSGGLPSQNKPRTGPPGGGLGHSRAKSTTTATTSSRTLSNAPVLRPPSQTSSTTSSTAPRQRPVSIHAGRPPSATERNPPKPAPAPSRAASSAVPPRPQPDTRQPHPVSRDAPTLRPKPAFSTHQQHFSPLRRAGPKTLTAAYLAPPSPSKLPSNVAASAETSRLQSSLLQLHLLHRSAPSTLSQWHASAHSVLAARHASLAASSRALSASESSAAESLNATALLSWPDTDIQSLDTLLTSLWSLQAPGGKFARLTRQFSRYADRLADAERARRALATDPSVLVAADDDTFLAGPLDAAWKDQMATLTRRLEAWADQLRDLPDPPPDAAASSLARILAGCRALVDAMLAETRVMQDIERAAVERERAWMRDVNREDDDGTNSGGLLSGRRDAPRAGAAWRTS